MKLKKILNMSWPAIISVGHTFPLPNVRDFDPLPLILSLAMEKSAACLIFLPVVCFF